MTVAVESMPIEAIPTGVPVIYQTKEASGEGVFLSELGGSLAKIVSSKGKILAVSANAIRVRLDGVMA